MLLGGALIPVAAHWHGWCSRPVRSIRACVVMLLGTGLTGLFLFHGLGIWVTLLNPRKGNYDSNFGNDLSLGGNIVLIVGVHARWRCSCRALLTSHWRPRWSRRELVAPRRCPALAPCAFYRGLAAIAAAPLFRARREKLLAVVEGRD